MNAVTNLASAENRDFMRRNLRRACDDATDEVVRLKLAFDNAREACYPGRCVGVSFVDLQSVFRLADAELHHALTILAVQRASMLDFEVDAAEAVQASLANR